MGLKLRLGARLKGIGRRAKGGFAKLRDRSGKFAYAGGKRKAVGNAVRSGTARLRALASGVRRAKFSSVKGFTSGAARSVARKASAFGSGIGRGIKSRAARNPFNTQRVRGTYSDFARNVRNKYTQVRIRVNSTRSGRALKNAAIFAGSFAAGYGAVSAFRGAVNYAYQNRKKKK